MKSFWHQLPKPFFVLAPMEAVTDVVFRHVVKKAGTPDVFYTEFANATGWVHAGNKAVGGRLVKTSDEHPIVAQIWGGEADDLEQFAKHCEVLGFDGIDINMGCPAKSAIKSGGAALIRQPQLATSAITSAKKAGLPVSVKTRLGYSSIDERRDWLTHILQQNITTLTIHLRTKKEMSKVPAHWELIPEIKALRDSISPNTLLVINGDIPDRPAGEQLAEQYGIDGIMIGRGVFTNPFCFRKNHMASKLDLINLLTYHLDLFDQHQTELGRPFETLKRFFKVYIRDFEGASDLRVALMNTSSTNQVRELIDNHKMSSTY